MRVLRFIKSHSFLIFFLTVQAIFLFWVISGASSGTAHCADTDYNCQSGQAGTAIGVGLIFVFWFVVDMILGVCYGVYRLATGRKK
jgi:hypothetical protein